MIEENKKFIPVMLTPFKDNGEVDFSALTSLTEFYLGAGANGLFANCQSSEMFSLSNQERLAVTKHIVDTVKGAVPVVATGIFGEDVHEHINFIKRISDCGVESVILTTGLLAQEGKTNEDVEAHVFQIIDGTEGIPLGFYECPEPFKRVFSAAQLKKFVDTGRVNYHKDTCLDINLVREKIDATRENPSFGLYDAYMAHAVESLKAGSAGLSCIQGNYFPELIVWLCKNYDHPDLVNQVSNVQQFFIDQMDVMHAVYPVSSKYFLQKRGLPLSTFSRRDVGDLDGKVKANMDALFNEYETLMDSIGLKSIL